MRAGIQWPGLPVFEAFFTRKPLSRSFSPERRQASPTLLAGHAHAGQTSVERQRLSRVPSPLRL